MRKRESPSSTARETMSSSGTRPDEKMTALKPEWLATAITLRCTCSVTRIPPAGA